MIAWLHRRLLRLFGKGTAQRRQDDDLRGRFHQEIQKGESAMRLGARIAAHTEHETAAAKRVVENSERDVDVAIERAGDRRRRIMEMFDSAADMGRRHDPT